MNASVIMGRRRTGIGIGADVDAAQFIPAANQSHASKNTFHLRMDYSFPNQKYMLGLVGRYTLMNFFHRFQNRYG